MLVVTWFIGRPYALGFVMETKQSTMISSYCAFLYISDRCVRVQEILPGIVLVAASPEVDSNGPERD